MRYPHLAAALFNAPLMVLPSKLDAIIAGLGPRLLGLGDDHQPDGRLFTTATGEYAKPGYRVMGNIAVIDVFGVLAHRGRMEADSSYVMGYQEVSRRLDAALGDNRVKGIVLQLDTPGGEANGAFDMADAIQAAGKIKPVWAAASDHALSAGYLIASAASRIAVSQSGSVGSIGVVMRHMDMSQAAAKEGVRVTYIQAGDKKTLGNPFEPLSEAARHELQGKVDALYGLFVESVSARRGLAVQAVRETQAGIYDGAAALDVKLADLIATPDQLIQEMQDYVRTPRRAGSSARVSSQSPLKRSTSMSHENDTGVGMDAPTFTQSDLDRARAEGHESGMKAERERAAAILGHEEAQGREKMANTLIGQGLAVDQAVAILAATPRTDKPAASGNAFAAAMGATKNPDIRPGQEGMSTEEMEAHAAKAGWDKAFGIGA